MDVAKRHSYAVVAVVVVAAVVLVVVKVVAFSALGLDRPVFFARTSPGTPPSDLK